MYDSLSMPCHVHIRVNDKLCPYLVLLCLIMLISCHFNLSPHSLMTKSLLYISSTVGVCWCWNWSKRNLLRMEVLPTPSAPITTSFARFSFQSMSRGAVSTVQEVKAVWTTFDLGASSYIRLPASSFPPCFHHHVFSKYWETFVISGIFVFKILFLLG